MSWYSIGTEFLTNHTDSIMLMKDNLMEDPQFLSMVLLLVELTLNWHMTRHKGRRSILSLMEKAMSTSRRLECRVHN